MSVKAIDICIVIPPPTEFHIFHNSFLVDVLRFSKLIIVSANNDSFASSFLIVYLSFLCPF